MELAFKKYEGAGNDFILVDDREMLFPHDKPDLVKYLCDRRFGIGADGLILLRHAPGYDFSMIYFNSDGKESSLCGNGGRCIVAFAGRLGLVKERARFMASDGEHVAELHSDGQVKLNMKDVVSIETGSNYYYLNTGSPHYVKFHSSVGDMDVFTEGRKIRYSDKFSRQGTNVNFVEDCGDHLFVRTYERGVENETLACGTGVVASVISAAIRRGNNHAPFSLPARVLGGKLRVSFNRNDNSFTDIWLEGPATYVFQGSLDLPE
jgi:diaminopimelate epimerase